MPFVETQEASQRCFPFSLFFDFARSRERNAVFSATRRNVSTLIYFFLIAEDALTRMMKMTKLECRRKNECRSAAVQAVHAPSRAVFGALAEHIME